MDKRTVVVSPFSMPLRTGGQNPKNFPHFDKLSGFLASKGLYIIQVGALDEERLSNVHEVFFGKSMKEVEKLVLSSEFFVSVDNFLPHLANYIGKRGVVIWGVSDPKLFGYPLHVNILKDRSLLRADQFNWWDDTKFSVDVFPTIDEVISTVEEKFDL